MLQIKNVTEPKSGCYDLSQILNVCEKGYEEDPEMIFRLITDVPSVKGSQDPIQMRPQEVELKMRTGKEFKLGIGNGTGRKIGSYAALVVNVNHCPQG